MLGDPTGVAFAPNGSLYIAEQANFRVRQVSPKGIISTRRRNGVAGFGGDERAWRLRPIVESGASRGGRRFDASISSTDWVRRVNTDGIITTVAGNGSSGFRR